MELLHLRRRNDRHHFRFAFLPAFAAQVATGPPPAILQCCHRLFDRIAAARISGATLGDPSHHRLERWGDSVPDIGNEGDVLVHARTDAR